MLVVGQATTLEEANTACQQLRPDVLVLEGALLSRPARTPKLLVAHPRTSCLILSEDGEEHVGGLVRGARGYWISKAASRSELQRAIRIAASGDSTCCETQSDTFNVVPVAPAVDELTPREVEVLGFVGHGLTNREIAERLVVSPRTVKAHVEHIIEKLGARDRTDAAVRALTLGYMQVQQIPA